MPNPIYQRRARQLNKTTPGKPGPVVYWMSRDQRANDNWALNYAQNLTRNQPLVVVFNLVSNFLGAGERQFAFMTEGLKQTAAILQTNNIPFVLLQGQPEQTIPKLIKLVRASALVTDFSPLKISRKWKRDVSRLISIPFYEVDAHNIVPCWLASPKQEFAARTFRPKIHKLMPEFLTEFPGLKKQKPHHLKLPKLIWPKVKDAKLKMQSGPKAAKRVLADFLFNRLRGYNLRNDPNQNAQSELSPYLHFGQLAPQRVALEVQKLPQNKAAEEFLEELIVRRELADNFCFYNQNYDIPGGFPDWAKKTLAKHGHDKREYLYSLKQLENAKTHDQLWNAAQLEIVKTGKMHGYLRMYWAKKILEWTKNPKQAMKFAIYLNDKYELDGRDPNGYAGIAWSIGGVHDRPWFSRPIFGQIRYMSFNGAKAKFNINAYIAKNSLK